VRVLFLIFTVACLSGCKQPQPARAISQKIDPANPLTENQVQQVKQKLHLLRSGMTSAQAFSTLGLTNNIIFFSQFTHTNIVLIRVDLDGESWTNNEITSQ
jgi:hypothetical protein